jgi:ureidoacrylate peracid hydrolase
MCLLSLRVAGVFFGVAPHQKKHLRAFLPRELSSYQEILIMETAMRDHFSEKRIEGKGIQLDINRTALLVVDLLNDFFEEGGAMVLPGGKSLYPLIGKLLDIAHEKKMPVFWLNQWLREDDSLFKKRVPHCIIDTWGAKIVDALPQHPEDIIIEKRRYSGFFQTSLDLFLRERDIKHLIVTGVVTNICVRSTVNDAFFLGYDVIVPRDCVRATSPEHQETHLYDIDTHYGTVINLDELFPVLEEA